MTSRFTPGDTVQTRFGKGVVREIRNGGRLTVDVQGRGPGGRGNRNLPAGISA